MAVIFPGALKSTSRSICICVYIYMCTCVCIYIYIYDVCMYIEVHAPLHAASCRVFTGCFGVSTGLRLRAAKAQFQCQPERCRVWFRVKGFSTSSIYLLCVCVCSSFCAGLDRQTLSWVVKLHCTHIH